MAKQSIFGILVQNRFSKRFVGFGLFGVYLFHIALVRSDSEPQESDTVGLVHLPKGGAKKSSYNFWLLCWGFKELDLKFMM